jgi:hypothetical protein
MLVQMMATVRVEARYRREMKKQRAGVKNERRFRSPRQELPGLCDNPSNATLLLVCA